MFKAIKIFTTAACLFIGTGTVFAAKHNKYTRFGEIVSVDAGTNKLVIKAGKTGNAGRVNFDLTSDTKVIKAGKEVTLFDLAAGSWVKVKCNNDRKTVETIAIMKGPKQAKHEKN